MRLCVRGECLMVIEHLDKRAHRLERRHDTNLRPRFFDLLDIAMLGELCRRVDDLARATRGRHRVGDRRDGDDEREAELASEALGDDLEMQEAEEAAAESPA